MYIYTGQSNSEHSRHWFFGGKITFDGVTQPQTLFQMVKATLPADRPSNSVIAFHDNSSAIRGFETEVLQSSDPSQAAMLRTATRVLHPILTAETHNFPT
jgi:phosphoribosylformylglycinamidine synthase